MTVQKPTMIDAVRMALLFTGSEFDDEIRMHIGAAKVFMRAGGIKAEKVEDDNDDVIRGCIVAYCKAQFGTEVDQEKLMFAFKSQVGWLKLTSEYGQEYKGDEQ